MPLRIAFMGTPEFAVPTLAEIAGQGHDVIAVYTRAPAPAGRGMALTRSPVHALADDLGIPVLHPKTLRTEEAQQNFRDHHVDVAVVVAYGMILPAPVLEAPELGCLNLHGSLLPRWRGAAPLQRAVMAGDAETGVMVMKMEEGLDTGPVAMVERIAIGPDDTAGDVHDRLMGLGADLMVRALAALSRGGLSFTPQAEVGVTYAKKIDKTETRIDWTRAASGVHDHIRGLSPVPGAWCEAPGGVRVKVLRTTRAGGHGEPGALLDDQLTVACGSAAVRLVTLQRAGKAPMPAAEFLRGTPLTAGTRLG